MRFLEMLQCAESPAFSPYCELSFQALLNLRQDNKPWDRNHSHGHHNYTPELMDMIRGTQAQPPESCLTQDVQFQETLLSKPNVKSETNDHHHYYLHHAAHSTCFAAAVGARFECNHHHRQPKSVEENKTQHVASGLTTVSPPAANRDKKKKIKRMRPAKNKDDAESQRMTHIAVERNRRRQMNDHLAALRSLMPSSHIQRGDQASIIGGAIDFVKELEQLLQSLQAQKRRRTKSELLHGGGLDATSSSISSTAMFSRNGMSAASSPMLSQCRNNKSEGDGNYKDEEGIMSRGNHEFTAEKKSGVVGVGVTLIQNHVNLKVECPRQAGQLIEAIVALENLRLTVLHLNITSLETSIHYSFNLKIEDECEVGSAEGIAVAVHQLFSLINGST